MVGVVLGGGVAGAHFSSFGDAFGGVRGGVFAGVIGRPPAVLQLRCATPGWHLAGVFMALHLASCSAAILARWLFHASAAVAGALLAGAAGAVLAAALGGAFGVVGGPPSPISFAKSNPQSCCVGTGLAWQPRGPAKKFGHLHTLPWLTLANESLCGEVVHSALCV